jgi:spore coat protein U-like protein
MKPLRIPSLIRFALFAAPMAFSALPALAGSACSVSAVGSIAFGTYSVFTATDTPGTGSFGVTNCNPNNTAYTAAASAGSGSYSARTMLLGTNSLQYNLYADSARTIIWGDGSNGTAIIAGTGSNNGSVGTSSAIYGSIPAQQDVPAGSYSDMITITITF